MQCPVGGGYAILACYELEVSNADPGARFSCTGALREPGAGEVAGLSLSRTGAELHATWGSSCVSTDDEFALYEGELGTFTTHEPVTCDTAGATELTFTPSTGSSYYLAVPVGTTVEGSHGRDSLAGGQRPRGPSARAPQQITVCDL